MGIKVDKFKNVSKNFGFLEKHVAEAWVKGKFDLRKKSLESF